jgi:hypothetical protein
MSYPRVGANVVRKERLDVSSLDFWANLQPTQAGKVQSKVAITSPQSQDASPPIMLSRKDLGDRTQQPLGCAFFRQ